MSDQNPRPVCDVDATVMPADNQSILPQDEACENNNVDGADLLAEITRTFQRFCVLPLQAAETIAAWVLLTYTHDAAEFSPVLALISPEKRCGKTTVLSVLGSLVSNPKFTSNISVAAIFRLLDAGDYTLLIDEADTFLHEKSEMTGILNSGHNRCSSSVTRCHGDDHEPREFSTWGPKCIAKIGQLPDTLEDRSIVVSLRRKRRDEAVERFCARQRDELSLIRLRAEQWAKENLEALRNSNPHMPDELDDRAADNGFHLCAIADLAGGGWPERIRQSLVWLYESGTGDEPQSDGERLLRDVAEVLSSVDSLEIGSQKLCDLLCKMPDSYWAEYRHGRQLTARGMANLLARYAIVPHRTRKGSVYDPRDFRDAFERYVPQPTEPSATSATTDTRNTNGP